MQILDAPVPQMGEQLVYFFKVLDTKLPVEQVIDVPEISDDIVQSRMVVLDLRFPQNAEQLVEVRTVLFFASLQQQTAEHIVNIPVPRGREGSGSGGGGLRGFSQDRVILCPLGRSLTIEFRVDVVIMEVFTVFTKGQNPAAVVEQSVDIPLPACGGPQLPDPGGSRSSAVSREGAGHGFFRTFPQVGGGCAVRREVECGAGGRGQLMDAGGL